MPRRFNKLRIEKFSYNIERRANTIDTLQIISEDENKQWGAEGSIMIEGEHKLCDLLVVSM